MKNMDKTAQELHHALQTVLDNAKEKDASPEEVLVLLEASSKIIEALIIINRSLIELFQSSVSGI